MPVDPRIPLGVQAPQINNPLDVAAAWGRVRQGEQAEQINALNLEQAQQRQATQRQEVETQGHTKAAIAAIRRGDDTQSIFANLSEEARPGVEEWLTKRKARIQADRTEAAEMIRRSGYATEAVELAFGLDDDPDGALEVYRQAKDDPEKLRRLVETYASPQDQPNLIQVDPTKDLADPKTGAIVRAGVPAAEKPPAVGSEGDYLARKALELGRPLNQIAPPVIGKWRSEYAAQTRAPQQPDYEWVTRDGKAVQIRKGAAQAGDAPYRAGISLSETMESPYQNALSRAVMSVPAIRRGSVVQHANRLWEEGNTGELKDVIRQAAVESEPVDVRNQVMGRMATVASLKDTRQILTELKTAGVPTGWLTGNVEDLARKLGKTTDPRYVELGNRLMGTMINYRRAATGVQFSERESADYQRMFPNYRNELPVNTALIDGLEREMNTYDQAYWTHKLGKDGARLVGVGQATAAAPEAPAPATPGGTMRARDPQGKLHEAPAGTTLPAGWTVE